MSAAAPPAQKKQICSTLTTVVKASPLHQTIDPKQFFMLVNANFPVIFRDGVVDLNPLWDNLVSSYAPEDLFGLFLKFGEETKRIGLEVALPPAVHGLSPDSRASLLATFPPIQARTSVPPSVAPPVAPPGAPNSVPPSVAPAPLPPEPPAAATEDTKQRVAWAVAQALKATPAGSLISTAQVQFLVTSRFEEMCDGKIFNFNPLLQAVLEIPEVTEEGLYVGIVRFKSLLANMGIEMPEPNLQLDAFARKRLVAEARAHSDGESFRLGGLTPAPQLEEVPFDPSGKAHGGTTEEKTKRKLRQFGLSSKSKANPKIALAMRILVWLLLIAGAVVIAVSAQPIQGIDVGPYQAVFPLLKADKVDGVFVGYLDETGWAAMSDDEKRKSTAALETVLRAKGYMRNVAVIDPAGKLVVFDLKGERLEISNLFIGPKKE